MSDSCPFICVCFPFPQTTIITHLLEWGQLPGQAWGREAAVFACFGQVSLYCESEAVLPETIRCNTFILGVAAFRDALPSPSAHQHPFPPLFQKHSLVDSKIGQIKIQWPQKPCCFTWVLSKSAFLAGVSPPTFSVRESTCSVAFWYSKGHCQVIEVKNMTCLKMLTSIFNVAEWLVCSNPEAEVWHLLWSRNTWPMMAGSLRLPWLQQKLREVLVRWRRAVRHSHCATLLSTAAKWVQFGWSPYLNFGGSRVQAWSL